MQSQRSARAQAEAQARAQAHARSMMEDEQPRAPSAPGQSRMPAELRSRPRIPRTPADGLRHRTLDDDNDDMEDYGDELTGAQAGFANVGTGSLRLLIEPHQDGDEPGGGGQGDGIPKDPFQTRAMLARTPMSDSTGFSASGDEMLGFDEFNAAARASPLGSASTAPPRGILKKSSYAYHGGSTSGGSALDQALYT